ncbi:MAG: helix-turn-helix domain-containing protein [bacterium]|nr:helix-turn-helix domain-containing protein [bacterium]
MNDWFLPSTNESELSGLNATERMVFLAIKSFCGNEDQLCWASGSVIAKRAGVAEGTICEVKKRLIQKKKVEKVGRKPVLGGYVDVLRVQEMNPLGRKSSLDESKGSPDETKAKGNINNASREITNDTELERIFNLTLKEIPSGTKGSAWQVACVKAKDIARRYLAKGQTVKSFPGLARKVLTDRDVISSTENIVDFEPGRGWIK